jgi:hypothetical protein
VEPYTISDELGATIEVYPCPEVLGRHGLLRVTGDSGSDNSRSVTATACVDTLNIQGLMNALYEVAGKTPPVILDMIAVDPDKPMEIGAIRIWQAPGGGAVFGIGGNSEALSPALVRTLAAAAVAYADAPPPPEPAEIDALTSFIGDRRNSKSVEEIARDLLRAGWRKP